MMSRKRFKWPVAAALLLSQLIGAESMAEDNPRSLDDLIKQVRTESVLESRELEAREQVFRQARDDKAALLQALAKLSERERDLLSLKFAAGLTNRRIAEIVGLSEANVGVIVYRALHRLRILLTAGVDAHA